MKISAHSDLSSDLEPSTPTESRHSTCLLGGKSPSVKLMSSAYSFAVLCSPLWLLNRIIATIQLIKIVYSIAGYSTRKHFLDSDTGVYCK